MNIEITIRAPELAAALVALSEALVKPLPLIESIETGATTEVLEKVEVPEKKAKKEKKGTEVEAVTTPEPEALTDEAPKTEYTLEIVRAKLAKLSQAGKQAEVKALITKFGAKKLTDIPADKYPQLMAEAEAI